MSTLFFTVPPFNMWEPWGLLFKRENSDTALFSAFIIKSAQGQIVQQQRFISHLAL